MKTISTIAAAVLMSVAAMAQTHVLIDLAQFNASPATNRYVSIQPLQPVRGNVTRYLSGASGTVTASNVVVADHLVTIEQRGSAQQIQFQFTVTATNLGTIGAHTNTSVRGAQTYPEAAKSAWSIQAADARYWPASNPPSSGGSAVTGAQLAVPSTNSGVVTITVPTNAVVSVMQQNGVVTNNNATAVVLENGFQAKGDTSFGLFSDYINADGSFSLGHGTVTGNASGNLTANSFSGALNGSDISSGTVAAARISPTVTNNPAQTWDAEVGPIAVAAMGSNYSAGAYNLLYASNGPSRLRAEWRQRRMMPPLMTASYNVFPTSNIGGYTNAGLESQNYMRWATNVLYFHSTNGMRASGYDAVQIDDGWQWRTNGAGETDLNGTTTWNTNVFPMGMPAYCDLAHSLGMKVVGYTSFTTNTCNTNGVGSPIHRVYQDIHTFMSWGWDGIKFDTCGDNLGSALANREYLKRYFRIVNQAIDDYYAIVQATNGTCREFIIGTPLVYQVMDPDQSTVTADVMDQVDWVFLNWNALSVALEENYIENIRTMAHVAMKLEPLLPPGKAVGMESFYNLTPGGGYTLGKWTNVLSLYAAMAAPMIGRFATWDWGTITNAAGEPPAENGGAPIYQLRVTGVYWTNQAFLNVLRDPAGIRGSLVWSNQGVEMWRRPLGSPDFTKDSFVTFSAATNSSLYHAATGNSNITVTVNDFGGRPSVRYKRLDIWTGISTEFRDSFTFNLTTNTVQAWRITAMPEPAISAASLFDYANNLSFAGGTTLTNYGEAYNSDASTFSVSRTGGFVTNLIAGADLRVDFNMGSVQSSAGAPFSATLFTNGVSTGKLGRGYMIGSPAGRGLPFHTVITNCAANLALSMSIAGGNDAAKEVCFTVTRIR